MYFSVVQRAYINDDKIILISACLTPVNHSSAVWRTSNEILDLLRDGPSGYLLLPVVLCVWNSANTGRTMSRIQTTFQMPLFTISPYEYPFIMELRMQIFFRHDCDAVRHVSCAVTHAEISFDWFRTRSLFSRTEHDVYASQSAFVHSEILIYSVR